MKKWILGFMAGLTSLPAFANLYGVSDIHVDVEAENAVKAKETALSEAAVQAFPKLFSRLVLVFQWAAAVLCRESLAKRITAPLTVLLQVRF